MAGQYIVRQKTQEPSFRAFITNEEILLKVLNDDEIKGRAM